MSSFSIPTKSVNKLHSELQCILDEERRNKNFLPKDFCDKRVDQLLHYMKVNNLKATVLSVSGGVDSGSVLGLLKRAQDKAALDPSHPFNPANGGKIIPIAQPINSTPEIQNRAYEVAEAFGVEIITVDQTQVHNKLVDIVEKQVSPGC